MKLTSGKTAPEVCAARESYVENVSVELLESFLRQLSHDVRNDLNAMELLISYVECERSGGDVGSALMQLHDAVRYGAQRMLRVSRSVQVPDLDYIPYPADILYEDLRDRVALERPQLAARIVWGRCELKTIAPVDATLALEALTELLENAAAFSSCESPVQIGVEACEAGVRWRILQHALDCPSNLEQWGLLPLVSTRRSHYGLGLFRVRRIIRAHQATLGFKYDAGGKKLATEVVFSSAP
ncbi:MAG: K+-sensing histidine kinase KdpD [Verrucomicrobia bacterium]|nr:MAG: K+-sensing histidine kinase KdpD [Verrucomicrobiota bacterium]